jgi:hypothetical protein
MTILVAGLTLLSGLLALLVVGLLRSHAEILRRLGGAEGGAEHMPPAQAEQWDPDVPRPREDARSETVRPIAGTRLTGDSVQVAFPLGGQDTLIAFLSSGCVICGAFWEAFSNSDRGLPSGTRLLIVTKDTTHESPSKLHDLAPADVPVVMSTSAWDDYGVPLAPYFVYVAGESGAIEGEGAAANWEQLRSLFKDFLFDRELLGSPHRGGEPKHPENGAGRLAAINRRLRAAGIVPGHPSLYDSPELPPEAEGDLELELQSVNPTERGAP